MLLEERASTYFFAELFVFGIDPPYFNPSDPITRIYDLINELGRAREYRRVKVSDILSRVKSKGYSEADLQRTLEQYEHLELLSRSANGDYVEFVFAQGAGPVDSDEDL